MTYDQVYDPDSDEKIKQIKISVADHEGYSVTVSRSAVTDRCKSIGYTVKKRSGHEKEEQMTLFLPRWHIPAFCEHENQKQAYSYRISDQY